MEINNAKLAYINNLVNKAINKPKQIWKIINDSKPYKCKSSEVPSTLNAFGLNWFFIDSVEDVICNIPKSIHSPYHYLNHGKAFVSPTIKTRPNMFSFHHVTFEKIHSIIMSLSNGNSLDVYNVNSIIIKSSSFHISEVRAHIINFCIDIGCFPDKINISKIIPVLKKGNKNMFGSYRPISVVPSLSKVFEKIICVKIEEFCEFNNLLTRCQFGFRKGCSTSQAVMNILFRNVWIVKKIDCVMVLGYMFYLKRSILWITKLYFLN